MDRLNILLFCFLLGFIGEINSELTEAEILNLMVGIRGSCQPLFKLDDELIDNIKLGKFVENKDLKCYVNCILEALTMMRRGKFNYDGAIKQINMFMPTSIRQQYIYGVEQCKNFGMEIKDPCEKSYAMLQCFYKNNPTFIFP